MFSFTQKVGISFVMSNHLPTCISSAVNGLIFTKFVLLLTATYSAQQIEGIVVFPWQHWLPKCARMLCYMSSALYFKHNRRIPARPTSIQVCELSRRRQQPCVWQTALKLSTQLAMFRFPPTMFP